MKRIATIYIATFAATCTLSYAIDHFLDGYSTETYIKHIRTPSISGLLTLGSFILSLNVFIILNLKEKLYDSPYYKESFELQKGLDNSLQYYKPLTQLGRLLTSSVPTILCAAAINLFIGPIEKNYTTCISIASTTSTFSLILYCWWKIKDNLFRWLEYLDDEEGPRHK